MSNYLTGAFEVKEGPNGTVRIVYDTDQELMVSLILSLDQAKGELAQQYATLLNAVVIGIRVDTA